MHVIEPDPTDGLPTWVVAAGDQLVPGQLAYGRFSVGHRCETWLTWSVESWCPAVVKLARPHQIDHPRAAATLGREVRALGGLNHPGLPRLLTDGRDSALPHLIFEYVDGPTLDEALDDGPLTSDETALLGTQLLAALSVVHARGVAHLHLKPENIVIRAGRPVLLDFGSARPIGAGQPDGRPVGTEGYAAPELEAGATIQQAMDLYGLGTVLFEALTAEPAFEPACPVEDRRLPSTVPGAVPQLVRRLLDPDPTRRPTAPDVLRELATLLADPALRPWPTWADAYLPTD